MRAHIRTATSSFELPDVLRWSVLVLALAALSQATVACDDGGGSENPTEDTALTDGGDDTTTDGGATDTSGSDATVGDSQMQTDVTDAGDADVDLPPIPDLPTQAPTAAPTDPLAGSGVQSCAVYQEETCDNGTLRRCAIYDTDASEFVDSPDPLLERVLLYDRWYDLYHQPFGQTAERVFTGEMPPGTPETTWGDPAQFADYAGLGDAAIWNGAALVAITMRYLETGTEADYQRMEQKLRDMLLQFDVTGIPGYLARHHFLLVDPAAPNDPRYNLHHDAETLNHKSNPIEDMTIDGLPDIYADGFEGPDGTVWTGTPMWTGHPSIDQYSGPRTAFPLVYPLLRDDDLKARMVEHMTCYLKRLKRIEITNLDENPDIRDELQQFFAGVDPQLDPDDIDFETLDTIVAYVHVQFNQKNKETFDRSCPDTIQMEPWRELDASKQSFLVDLLDLVADMRSGESERNNGIDHFYVPSVRGADAIHLMQLSALAYDWTGDEQYREFLYRELVGKIRGLEVAHTAGAFNLPIVCRKFYGHHISFTPTWGFLTLLGESELKTEIQRVFEIEMWQKEMRTHDNAKFNIMYAGEVPDAIATEKETALATALAKLNEMGGNGGDDAVLVDPKRRYDVPRTEVIDQMTSAGNEVVCPTMQEREVCEQGFEILGLQVPGRSITVECTGVAGECSFDDGCVLGLARDALPMSYRHYSDFAWQRNPFTIGTNAPVSGQKQSPGLDLMEEFWLARWYGFLDAGEGQVLAWQDAGTCP